MKPTNHKPVDSGFALPIAIGFGAIMIILGTTMIIRSNQSQIASLSQRSSHQSLAAAESGVSQFLSLFNRYRVFASADPDDWDTLLNEIQDLPDCNTFASGSTAEENILDSVITDSAQEISVDPSDADKGRYILTSYVTSPTAGTLGIRGIANDPQGTSVTDLEVTFPIDEIPINASSPTSSAPPSSTQACSNFALSLVAANTETLPIDDFSQLRQDINDASLTNVRNVTPGQIQGQSLPLSGDANEMTYIVNGNLSLSDSNQITISSGQTVFLVTEDDIEAQGDGVIQIEEDASLFLISYGDVTLRGSNVEPIRHTPLNRPLANRAAVPLHAYLLAENSTLEIGIPDIDSSGTVDIPIVAYAPFGNVNLNLDRPVTNSFEGEVWAKNFEVQLNGTLDPSFFSRTPNPLRTAASLSEDFWQERLNIERLPEFNIRPINSWKRNNTS